jgi:hypothetical protein
LECAYVYGRKTIKGCFIPLPYLTGLTELSPYKELLDGSRWERLIEQFRQDNYCLFQLASQLVFTVALQAGLSALKTPYPLQIQQESLKYYFKKHKN